MTRFVMELLPFFPYLFMCQPFICPSQRGMDIRAAGIQFFFLFTEGIVFPTLCKALHNVSKTFQIGVVKRLVRANIPADSCKDRWR
jgi:hypothetical protein